MPSSHTRPTGVPAGRGIIDNRTTLWASWVVEQTLPITLSRDKRASIFFAGYGTFFHRVSAPLIHASVIRDT